MVQRQGEIDSAWRLSIVAERSDTTLRVRVAVTHGALDYERIYSGVAVAEAVESRGGRVVLSARVGMMSVCEVQPGSKHALSLDDVQRPGVVFLRCTQVAHRVGRVTALQ